MENNYGTLNGYGAQERASTVKRSQVYLATHDGEGKSLPFMNRSFISFSFGGKWIEEFDLIATTSGNRMNRKGYANFQDRVSTYDNLDGQYYWSTHYQTNQLDLTLSTDGIDQKKLDDFLHWFKAGETRELILAEHPNRAILARMTNPPQLNLLPFEQAITITLSSVPYQTSTTLYKGDINISFVMDEPHWYAVTNILGQREGDAYTDKWHDPHLDQDVWIVESKDALKILYEDGIPLGSMIDDSMLLGNGAYASVNNEDYSLLWSILEDDLRFEEGTGARIEPDENPPRNLGIIAGAMVDISGNGISSLGYNQQAYFFYAGTAPAPTLITFTMTPKFNNSNYYLVTPANTYSGSGNPYNTITIASEHLQTLRFTTPNIFTSYNKVIKIFIDMVNHNNPSYTWEDIRKKIRDDVRHPLIRAWANKIIESITDEFVSNATANIQQMCRYMSYLFYEYNTDEQLYHITPVTFSFNSATGESKGIFRHRIISGTFPDFTESGDWLSYNHTNLTNITEDVGDMLKSNYIILQDRNYPTSDGKVLKWENKPSKLRNSHMFKHDCDVSLSNISILYKNMYL